MSFLDRIPQPYRSELMTNNYRSTLQLFAEREYSRLNQDALEDLLSDNPSIGPLTKFLGNGIDMVTISFCCGIGINLARLTPRMEEVTREYDHFYKKERDFYKAVVDAMYDIQTVNSEPISLEELAASEDFRNEVVRKVFAQRSQAKEFLDLFYNMALTGFRIAPRLHKFIGKYGHSVPGMNLVPDPETSKKFLDAVRWYCDVRLEEIYK